MSKYSMLATPRFSIVVPTRNRPETLRHSLATCLDQDFDDYEILVSDNSDPAAAAQVAEIVAVAASSRIRYLPPERPLAMSANWERGLSQVRGEYVTVLGDDDGLMPYAPMVTVGSYCVVFDTVVEDLPESMFPDRPWGPGDNPKTAVHEFLKTHAASFEIDRTMDNKLLVSVAPDGYLKRVA